MSTSPERYCVVLTTAGSDEQAEAIARALVERRLAACVNIVGPVGSVYRWEGRVVREEERLLVIKTAERVFDTLRDAIRELHAYDVPEIVRLPIEGGDDRYLGWISDCL